MKKWDKACRRQADGFGASGSKFNVFILCLPACSDFFFSNSGHHGEHDGQLYLARQVEVQPVFNREFIAELSDVASANLLSLENLLASDGGGNKRRGAESLADGTLIEGYGGSGAMWTMDIEQSGSAEALEDLEHELVVAVKAGDQATIDELLKVLVLPANARGPSSPISRILWRAVLEDSPKPEVGVWMANGNGNTNESNAASSGKTTPSVEAAIPTSLLDFTYVDDINGRTSLHEVSQALFLSFRILRPD